MNKETPPQAGGHSHIRKRINDALIIRGAAFAPIASLIILLAVAAMSLVFLFLERNALIERTHDTCRTIAVGLSSVAIESIAQNKPLTQEYINELSKRRIPGLTNAYVVKFISERVEGKKGITGGVIIAAYQYAGRPGDTLPYNKVRELAAIREFRKDLVIDEGKNDAVPQAADARSSTTSYLAEFSDTLKDIFFGGSSGTYYQYSYPIVWKFTLHREEQIAHLGMVRLRFLKSEMLRTFYQTRTISFTVIIITLALVGGLVFFYVLLVNTLKEKLRVIEKLSVTDPLTGLCNRKKLNDTLDYEIARIRRYGGTLAVIMFDMDHFKLVNDTCGHDAGDAVLVGMAKLVAEELRETDTFARWGGEEFVILLPDNTGREAAHLAERLRVKAEAAGLAATHAVTASFGVAHFAKDQTRETFLKSVDEALYAAKDGGRNRVVMYAKAMQ